MDFEMTEEEVLAKMDQFKNAIIKMKDEIKSLRDENERLKNNNTEYTFKVHEKLDEIEKLLSE